MYKVEISNGELIDKYTILLIKKDKIKDNYKLNKVNQEINILTNYIIKLNINFDLTDLINKLKEINSKLWNIEDNIRIKEKNKEFDDEFINLARSVYFTNDDRAKIKLEINNITKSEIIEVKSYEKYD